MKKYSQYKAKVAETLTEIFLKRTGHVVVRIGGEEVLSTLFDSGVINSAMVGANNDSAKAVMSHLMGQFDLAVFGVDGGNIKRAFLLDVKCWDFTGFEVGKPIGGKDFVEFKVNDTSLVEQAEKYKGVHENAGLFIFAKVKNDKGCEIIIFYETIKNICAVAEGHGLSVSQPAWKNSPPETFRNIRLLGEHSWTKSQKIKDEVEQLAIQSQMLCV